MPKIKIQTKLKTSDNQISSETFGIYQNDKIIFIENNVKNILKLNESKFIRETTDYKIELAFSNLNNTKGIYLIKNRDIKMDLYIKTNEYIINDSEIFINYDLKIERENMGNFDYHIKYEVVK